MWKSVSKANVGVIGGIQTVLQTLNSKRPHVFPPLSDDHSVFVASDYSGSHSGASYLTYSFVVTTPSRWSSWERERLAVRGMFLLSRTMSFKALNDSKRQEALPHFLAAANRLEGITITLAVHKGIRTLFGSKGRLDLGRTDLAMLRGWKEKSAEHFLRVTHLAALFVVGLSVEGQRVTWITDEDEIVANEDRLGTAAQAFGNIVDGLSDHQLDKLQIGTTKADNGTLQLEDLAAIADFSAGAVAEAMTSLDRDNKPTEQTVATPLSQRLPLKTKSLLLWLATDDFPHRHVTIAVDPGDGAGQVNLRMLNFESIQRPRAP